MGSLVVSLVVLLCATQATLGEKFDCSTEAGQMAFLQNGTRSDPDCYNPIIRLVASEVLNLPTPDQLKVVCQKSCVGVVIDFLRGTEKCRNNETIKSHVYLLEDELCAFKDGIDKPESSCLSLNTSRIDPPIRSCFAWWYLKATSCPALFPNAGTTTTCTDALKDTTKEYGCCFQNLFGTKESIDEITQNSIDNLPSNAPVPVNFEINVTDSKLFAACGVSLPDMCKSTLETASALSPMVTPLLALLFAILAKLAVY